MLLETEQLYPEFKSAYSYIYLFVSWTSMKELCLQLSRLFCIKMPQTLQQSFQKLTDTLLTV